MGPRALGGAEPLKTAPGTACDNSAGEFITDDHDLGEFSTLKHPDTNYQYSAETPRHKTNLSAETPRHSSSKEQVVKNK